MLNNSFLPSPKLTAIEKRNALYPYYAGFSESFVNCMLEELGAEEGSLILDPWNGSGTTTYLASVRGIRSIGIDLNPVVTTVARARCASDKDVKYAKCAWQNSAKLVTKKKASVVEHLANIYKYVIMDSLGAKKIFSESSRSIILCALFRAARQLLQSAKSKNPTWYILSPKLLNLLKYRDVFDNVDEQVKYVINHIQKTSSNIIIKPNIKTGDFLKINVSKGIVDIIIASPPYLTRLDYVKTTLPELLLLSKLDSSISIDGLRHSMIGSPVISINGLKPSLDWGKTAHQTLTDVYAHRSKASTGYYYKFYLQYFDKIYRSLAKIYQLLKPGGKLVLVVQTSYYKELFIDLPAVVAEMCNLVGLSLVDKFEFNNKLSMVNVNSRAVSVKNCERRYESAILFKK